MNLKDQNNPAVLNAIAEIVKKNRDDALQEDQKNATVSTTKYANFKPSSVQEALIGNQHKIDHNKNNKIDAHDFKLMRGKKKAVEVKEEEQLDEISKKLAANYVKANRDDTADSAHKLGQDPDYDGDLEGYVRKRDNRDKGMDRAVKRLTKEGTDTPGNGYTHQCAIHVKHSKLGEGRTIYSQHAAPDNAGNIAWYDVMFAEGIYKQVPTTDLEVLVSESHGNHKRK